jgi:recombination protein RecA
VARAKKTVEETEQSEFEKTVAEIQNRYGAPTVHLARNAPQPTRIPTNVFMLDFCLLGGIPHNRVTTIVGERHAGKSMIADMITASAQRMYPDGLAVKMDIEGTHDSVWSEKLGVDIDRQYVVTPETGESAVDMTEGLIRSKETSIIVVDSIAALVPMKEVESSAEDQLVGEQARLVGKMVRKVTTALIEERKRNHEVTLVLLNQFRTKIGVMYGDPRTSPGGKALEFAATVHLVMKNKEKFGKDEFDIETVEENEHAFQITKNKMNSGPRTGEFRVRRLPNEEYGLAEGSVDDASTLLAYAKKFGHYSGGGSAWELDFWNFKHTMKGADAWSLYLYHHPTAYWMLRNFLIWTQAKRLGMPDYFLQSFLDDHTLTFDEVEERDAEAAEAAENEEEPVLEDETSRRRRRRPE